MPLPHVWLGSGADRISTSELVGTSWTLLCGPRSQPWRFAADALVRELGIDLRCRRIDAQPGVTDVQQAEFCLAVGIEPDGAVLVRPDGIMAWRCPTVDPDPYAHLRSVVSELLFRC